MCEKQTSVSHSSTESEIISLDAGLRLDGLPALELWDLIVSVLGNVSRVSDRSGQPDYDVHKHHKSQNKIDVMENIDAVPSNVQSARQEALLYVFEDNEAVIKMIIKGRSPTMRHVSRTHRVALDWLFDRINLDSKIQIKYIDTKIKLADILTKGNFTRDEWNHLLCLFNISHFSSTVCSGETISTRFRGRTSHSKIATKDESYCKGAVARIILNFSKPGEEKQWKSPGVQLLKKRKDRGDPMSAATERPHLTTITMNNLWKAFPQQAIQSWMTTVLGLLKSGKLKLRHTSDRGDLMKLLGERHERFDLVSPTRKLFTTEPRNPL